MSHTTEQMKTHLEFLGYRVEIEPNEGDASKPFYYARPSTGYRITFWEPAADFYRFSCRVSVAVPASPEMNQYVNQANRALGVSSVFYTGDPDGKSGVLHIASHFNGDYGRERFGAFFNAFRDDLDGLSNVENYNSVFFPG